MMNYIVNSFKVDYDFRFHFNIERAISILSKEEINTVLKDNYVL